MLDAGGSVQTKRLPLLFGRQLEHLVRLDRVRPGGEFKGILRKKPLRLARSVHLEDVEVPLRQRLRYEPIVVHFRRQGVSILERAELRRPSRSEEHTSELQS